MNLNLAMQKKLNLAMQTNLNLAMQMNLNLAMQMNLNLAMQMNLNLAMQMNLNLAMQMNLGHHTHLPSPAYTGLGNHPDHNIHGDACSKGFLSFYAIGLTMFSLQRRHMICRCASLR